MKKLFIKVLCGILTILTVITAVSCKRNTNEEAEISDTTAEETTEASGTRSEEQNGIPQYKVLYNSDTTHIEHISSPYHPTTNETRLTKDMVQASAQEAIDAGSDCYIMTPGQCWVPWWPSQYIEQHKNWFYNELGGTKNNNPYWNYVHVLGNDMIQDSIDVCRENGVGFFINFRLNDHHYVENVGLDASNADIASISEIQYKHPEYAIGYIESYNRTEKVMDFRHEEVRQNRLDLIRELIENYEMDGFELDFTRKFWLFNVDKTTSEERLGYMLDMITQIREMLDEQTEKDGRYRHLSVRIPMWGDFYDEMGIDLEEYEKAGVTMFNMTSSYFTVQEFDMTSIREQLKTADLYCELHFISAVGYDSEGKRIHRRATVEQLATTALMAYEQGVTGISLFNFQYYRGDGVSPLDAPLTEPPWEVIELLGDYEKLKQMPQHYFLGKTWKDTVYSSWSLPKTLVKNKTESFKMYGVSPQDGWTQNGILSFQSEESFTGRVLEVSFNGVKLNETAWTSKPYENEYTQLIGTAENYRSYIVPLELMTEGDIEISIKMTSGAEVTISFIELSIQ